MKTKLLIKIIAISLLSLMYTFGFGSIKKRHTMSGTKPTAENGSSILEIRSYNLKPGTREEFHRIVLKEALPMLTRWKIDVVAFGPSPNDNDSYFVIRRYKDIPDMEQQEAAFYGSDEWKNGPREKVLSHIINYTTIVIPSDSLGAWLSKKSYTDDKDVQSSDMDQLKTLNAQFIRNWVTSDTVKHNQIIHKDFVYVSSSGKIVDRDQYMKNWAKGYNPKVDKSFEYKNEFIRIFGNMALVRSNTSFSWVEKGKTHYGQNVYTDTYVKENGRWYCVQAQVTDLK